MTANTKPQPGLSLTQETYTLHEVADILQVSVPTVRQWHYRGELPTIRPGNQRIIRVTRAALEEFALGGKAA